MEAANHYIMHERHFYDRQKYKMINDMNKMIKDINKMIDSNVMCIAVNVPEISQMKYRLSVTSWEKNTKVNANRYMYVVNQTTLAYSHFLTYCVAV